MAFWQEMSCTKICVEQKSKRSSTTTQHTKCSTIWPDRVSHPCWCQMDTGCSDAESSSSHGVSWSNVVFKAADRGITQEVMICRMKMFCCWWSFKPTVSPVVTMAIHTFVQWAFGFSYVLFVATAARDQIHNILSCAVCVLSQSYSGPRRWLHSASRGYHFAALTSFSATGSTFTSWWSFKPTNLLCLETLMKAKAESA